MPTPLLIGSCEPFSGKSAVVLGLARLLIRQGVDLAFGKPLATPPDAGEEEAGAATVAAGGALLDGDARFIADTLGLTPDRLLPSLHLLDAPAAGRCLAAGSLDAAESLAALRRGLDAVPAQLALLEAAGSLSEGLLFGLSLVQLARGLEAPVVLVHGWQDSRSADALLEARRQLGDLLAGVVLNGVDPEAVPELRGSVAPALERLGIPVFGVLPRSPLLRSISVDELRRRLQARVLCCADRLDLLVETLSIGAMNVNSAMEFFRRRRNMAVVTGADRTDIQLAALEASTQCLILTGAGDPLPQLISRAEELEVPVLKVEHDTLTTVEVIEASIGHVRLHEADKATYAIRLVAENAHFEPLFARLGLPVQS